MVANLLITFRETIEASLIVMVIMSYLYKTSQKEFIRVAYGGIVAGILGSVAGALLFNIVADGFTGKSEQIFEGITMLAGAFLLTTMIFWMMSQKNISNEIKNKVEKAVSNVQKWNLFFLVFLSILREGIETVIFLSASQNINEDFSFLGACTGVFVAISLIYILYTGIKKVNLKYFFNASSILLILFAAGLTAHGVHELEEAGILPVFYEHIWDINPPANTDGSFPALHEKGQIGVIFKGLFGYNGNPSFLEVVSYVLYLLLSIYLWKTIKAKSGKADVKAKVTA